MSSYRVPSMAEVAEIKGTNGLKIVSTFSGCGGSCLGFEMAGYEALYANEFIDEARTTYERNHPGVYVDGRDIRLVTAEEIRKVIGDIELDVLEGSPPCASFSLAGKRDKHWGAVKSYSDKEQRADDLFFEFARLLKDLQPKAFVAENVKGLVIGKAKGYFKWILSELKNAGYQVEARILDASYLGVPQSRPRVIFIGFRNDLGISPVFPTPSTGRRISLRDALNCLPDDPENFIDEETGEDISLGRAVASQWDLIRPGESSDKYFQLVRPEPRLPVPTITASGGQTGLASVTHPYQRRKFNLKELRLLSSFPEDFVLTGTYKQRYERIGRSVPPLMMKAIAEAVRDELLRIR